jgi:hypothetical protein
MSLVNIWEVFFPSFPGSSFGATACIIVYMAAPLGSAPLTHRLRQGSWYGQHTRVALLAEALAPPPPGRLRQWPQASVCFYFCSCSLWDTSRVLFFRSESFEPPRCYFL